MHRGLRINKLTENTYNSSNSNPFTNVSNTDHFKTGLHAKHMHIIIVIYTSLAINKRRLILSLVLTLNYPITTPSEWGDRV